MNTDQKIALEKHNEARKEIGIAPPTWSWRLVEEAQEWADYLAGKDISEAMIRVLCEIHREDSVLTLERPRARLLTYITSLFAAQKWHRYHKQMLSAENAQLGIASARKDDGTIIVVARYWPVETVIDNNPSETDCSM